MDIWPGNRFNLILMALTSTATGQEATFFNFFLIIKIVTHVLGFQNRFETYLNEFSNINFVIEI